MSYEWDATGAPVTGSNTGSLLHITMPDTVGQVVTVNLTVTVTDTGASQSLVAQPFSLRAIDPQLAHRLAFFCRLFTEAPSSWFVNPLLDPLRDLVIRPSEHAVTEVARFLTRLGDELITVPGPGADGPAEHRPSVPARPNP